MGAVTTPRSYTVCGITVALSASLLLPADAAAQQDGGAETDATARGAFGRTAAYLSTLAAFRVRAVVSVGDDRTGGRDVQPEVVADMLVERPNRLLLDLISDRQRRVVLYDGQLFTLWAPKMRYYAQVDAPDTLISLVDHLADHYELELPTVFRRTGLDGQVWLQPDQPPLPRQVVLRTQRGRTRPEYTALYTWNLAPAYSAESFTFVAPDDATRIPLREVARSRTRGNGAPEVT